MKQAKLFFTISARPASQAITIIITITTTTTTTIITIIKIMILWND